jgi:hypothetical protein
MIKQIDLHIEWGRAMLLLWFGSRLSIFYRKRFKIQDDTRPFVDLGTLSLAIWYSHIEESNLVDNYGVILFACHLVELFRRLDSYEETLKSLLLAGSLHFASTGTVASLFWVSLCIMATTQLLRWPATLKLYLRNLRTVCGPSYAILIAGACFKESFCFSASHQEARPIMSMLRSPSLLECAGSCAILASVVFRPDNTQLWRMLPFAEKLDKRNMIPSAKLQKQFHASLMILSYVCMVAKFTLLEFHHPWKVVGYALIALSYAGLFLGVSSISTVLTKSQATSPVLSGP